MAEAAAEAPVNPSEVAASQWAELVSQYQKQAGQAMSAAAPFMGAMAGALPFPGMGFGQPFMYPAPMMFPGMSAFNPAAFGMTGPDAAGEVKPEAGASEEKQEAAEAGGEETPAAAPEPKQEESAGPKTRKRGALTRAASAPSGKKAKGEAGGGGGGMGVKSNSSAALAMLAGAAAGKNAAGAAAAAGAGGAAPAANGSAAPPTDAWAAVAAGSPAQLGSMQDVTKLKMDQAALMGVTDERELKRLRRKQSNRESARRSRLRKQAECEALARQVKDLITENSKLKEEKLQLLAQIEILNAKLSMSTFGAVHALGQGELEKIQAELRKQTEAQQASMAAALAQVNATIAANGSGEATEANADDKESQSDADD